MGRLDKKVVLLTGAAGGVGAEIARVLAREGATLALNHLEEEKETVCALAAELAGVYGGRHQACAADITREEEVRTLVKRIHDDAGSLDVLINNAGISITGLAWKYPVESWEKVLAVNLSGAFFCAKAVLPGMHERKWGRIINISSVVGLSGATGTAAYGASKAGLIGLSLSLAREVAGDGITVNCVAPGYLNTGIIRDVPDRYREKTVIPSIPMGRLGEAADVANAVLFLASDEAGYITGEVLRVDGGHSM
ncbi:MAG: 3-oxoacyl-ACP reductase FabG [Desulfovibrionaceae bacterium]|nr:3-oxoacyl-ACP reductase FabG [Desulfovibrionaceae bacterium]